MRISALFPVLCCFIALILSFLCTFAGTDHDMLEQYSLFTLNTSRIGVNYFEQHKHNSSSPANHTSGGFFSSLVHNATAELKNVTDKAEDKIEDDINHALRSLAKDIGIHDFYSVHLLDYCEGFFKGNTSDRNVTYCSDGKGAFAFNATQVLQKELNTNSSHNRINITLGDLHWPKAINDGIQDLKLAFHVTAVFYYLAITFVGLALVGSLVGVFNHGRLSALVNMGFTFLAFFSFMIASAIVTWSTTKAAEVVNKYGKEVDVNAARGDKFIAMTWAGVALCAVAYFAWFGECLAGRRKEKLIPKQLQ